MRITFFPMVATITCSVLYIFLCFLFVVYFDMGIIGLAAAMSIKDCALFLMTLIYCYNSETVCKVLIPFDSESFQGLSEYLMLSISSSLMTMATLWSLHLITLMAGFLGVVEMASITAILSFRLTLFTFALSVGEGASTLIGNCIGANNVPLAKRFYYMIGAFTIGMTVTMSLITFFANEQLASLITNEKEVKDTVKEMLILVSIVFVFDAGQGFL